MTTDATRLEAAQHALARCWLGAALPTPSGSGGSIMLGAIELRPHQVDAVHQLAALLDAHGGAVLADVVGLGKTYVALALARQARGATIVCPAGLRTMWEEAAALAGVSIAITTTESLSRATATMSLSQNPSTAPSATPNCSAPASAHRARLVIVDEAHHCRNPYTHRYRALARLTAGVRLLLLTASPVHNRTGDLAAVLSLFLGARAWTLTDDQRARYVVRRSHEAMTTQQPSAPGSRIPRVLGPHVIAIDEDDETLRAIVSLPPPIPPRDGNSCDALTAMGLVRQWSSSAGALRAALVRRLERAAALEESLVRDVYPSYRDLREWCLGDGAVQLAWPEILIASAESLRDRPDDPSSARRSITELLEAVRHHAHAVRALLRRLGAAPAVDRRRAELLRAIRDRHRGSKVVAFSSYEDTIHSLFRLLCHDGGVCALSARGGRIATGLVSRAEVVRQFDPGSRQRVAPAASIGLLLTTDLLSEGVNLQLADIVVHLDLPWTPARLEQRVGRVARLGSPHSWVRVYAFAPPAGSDLVVGIERRLREKVDAAGRAVGIAGSIVPVLTPRFRPLATVGPPEHLADVRRIVERWARGPNAAPKEGMTGRPIWASASAPQRGFLAACVGGGQPLLVGEVDDAPSDAPTVLARAARLADGVATPLDANAYDRAVRAILQWWDERCAEEDAGLTAVAGAAPRLRVLGRIAAITRRAPMHLRPTILGLGDRARRAAVTPCGSGAEWVLDQLAGATMDDVQWLRAVAAFGDAHRPRPGAAASSMGRVLQIVAVVVFG